jgi:IclR family acetate operon transcriptional repressor
MPQSDVEPAEIAPVDDAQEKKGIQSIERATALLEIIAEEGGSARLQTIAARANLKKSTAHNILATLERLGYVRRRATDSQYHLGDRIMNLSRMIGDDGSLRARLRPTIEAISMRSGESVFLAVPSGDQIFYIDGIDADDPNRGCDRIGARRPLEGSAIGLVFLALISELRQRVLSIRPDALNDKVDEEIAIVKTRGFAIDRQSASPDINCVAVPVFEGGRVCACIAVRGNSDRLTGDMLNDTAWMMIRVIGMNQAQPQLRTWRPLPLPH